MVCGGNLWERRFSLFFHLHHKPPNNHTIKAEKIASDAPPGRTDPALLAAAVGVGSRNPAADLSPPFMRSIRRSGCGVVTALAAAAAPLVAGFVVLSRCAIRWSVGSMLRRDRTEVVDKTKINNG